MSSKRSLQSAAMAVVPIDRKLPKRPPSKPVLSASSKKSSPSPSSSAAAPAAAPASASPSATRAEAPSSEDAQPQAAEQCPDVHFDDSPAPAPPPPPPPQRENSEEGTSSGFVPSVSAAAAKQKKPPFCVPAQAQGTKPVLQSEASIDGDELYGEQEKALTDFLRLHPMLSLESTSHRTLQLVADLVNETAIPTRTLEIVPKSYDDSYLRPADASIGERSCCLADRCICSWLAKWRYGDATDLAFVGAEFLVPSALAEFTKTGKLPATHGKCLVCARYFHTFLYRCARTDPSFNPSASIPLQAFGNQMGMGVGDDVPLNASMALCADGYREEV